MILELLGKICDAEACAAADSYIGYCVDMVSATQNLPGASHIYVVITTNVAADYTTGDEYYQFQLRTGTGTDGTDINAGAITLLETPSMAGDDARLDTAGDAILDCSIPMRQMTRQRYWQLYYAQAGTTPSITIDASFSFAPSRTNYNIQVESSPVGLP